MHKTGKCECGAVAYQSEGPWRDIIACHCTQCRRLTGHYWAATAVPAESLELTHDEGLAWRRSSDFARRGFCNSCGSAMFYQHDEKDYIAIGAGTLDGPTGLKMVEEVFAADKGDYYQLSQGIPHHATWSKAWKDD